VSSLTLRQTSLVSDTDLVLQPGSGVVSLTSGATLYGDVVGDSVQGGEVVLSGDTVSADEIRIKSNDGEIHLDSVTRSTSEIAVGYCSLVSSGLECISLLELSPASGVTKLSGVNGSPQLVIGSTSLEEAVLSSTSGFTLEAPSLTLNSLTEPISISSDLSVRSDMVFSAGYYDVTGNTIACTRDIALESGTSVVSMPSGHLLEVGNILIDSSVTTISAPSKLRLKATQTGGSVEVDSATTFVGGSLSMYRGAVESSTNSISLDSFIFSGSDMTLELDTSLVIQPRDGYGIILNSDAVSVPDGTLTAGTLVGQDSVTVGTVSLVSGGLESTGADSSVSLVPSSGRVEILSSSSDNIPRLVVGNSTLTGAGVTSSGDIFIQGIGFSSNKMWSSSEQIQ
ncbi:hypothetical protein KIPB_012857, partial [Kipferlia bialata]